MPDPVALPRHWLLRSLDLETTRATDPAQIAHAGLTAFREALEEAKRAGEGDAPGRRSQLEAYAGRLMRAQGSNGMLAGGLQQAISALDGGPGAALEVVDRLLTRAEASGTAVVDAAEGLFRPGARVLTLGHSPLIAQMLARYGDRLEMVTVCEGRPLNEGARLAGEVAAQAIPVRLVTEAQLALVVPQCDLAVVAAAQILPDGSAIAGVGTAVLAYLCRALHVRCYVVAPRALWTQEHTEHAQFRPDRRNPAEVLSSPPQGVQVSNLAQDRTPAELISGYVTEEGITAHPPEVKRAAA